MMSWVSRDSRLDTIRIADLIIWFIQYRYRVNPLKQLVLYVFLALYTSPFITWKYGISGTRFSEFQVRIKKFMIHLVKKIVVKICQHVEEDTLTYFWKIGNWWDNSFLKEAVLLEGIYEFEGWDLVFNEWIDSECREIFRA